jgi:amino acid transporter
MILAAASILNPDYIPAPWQTFLLTALLMLIQGCIASMPTRWIARFNGWGCAFNVIAILVVIIIIPFATNRQEKGHPRFANSYDVWTNIYPGTDFPSGIAILMSFVAVIWTMSGKIQTLEWACRHVQTLKNNARL